MTPLKKLSSLPPRLDDEVTTHNWITRFNSGQASLPCGPSPHPNTFHFPYYLGQHYDAATS
ncbi:hypothetical protein AMTR_s00067p00035790 [Amborella trichopoda]|uniref:Uncharacterized protein n=1 Tax=Amborella trichopoda TaxID=13333 RepID=U5D8F3_AMBTC|nr:hypothetical protein AMTR_s00067p00035790 [Amborella trichopoda]